MKLTFFGARGEADEGFTPETHKQLMWDWRNQTATIRLE
jgi:hypothetical protein